MPERAESNLFMDTLIDALREHVRVLTVDIGERSVDRPDNLARTAEYIRSFHEAAGLRTTLEPYRYRDTTVANVIAETGLPSKRAGRYLLGAHYDCVRGTVGADDNASSVAVLLETARLLSAAEVGRTARPVVKLVAFALEEHPAFWSPYRGSWVHAKRARSSGERIDGMLCLEMVGYRSRRPGSQKYPFPLMHMNYPRVGDFIGVIGDTRSAPLVRSVCAAFARNPRLPAQHLVVPFRGWLTHFVRRSDHVSFWDSGYRAVMLTDTAEFRNPNYHGKSDTLETLDFEFMAELVRSLFHFFSGPEPLTVTGEEGS